MPVGFQQWDEQLYASKAPSPPKAAGWGAASNGPESLDGGFGAAPHRPGAARIPTSPHPRNTWEGNVVSPGDPPLPRVPPWRRSRMLTLAEAFDRIRTTEGQARALHEARLILANEPFSAARAPLRATVPGCPPSTALLRPVCCIIAVWFHLIPPHISPTLLRTDTEDRRQTPSHPFF